MPLVSSKITPRRTHIFLFNAYGISVWQPRLSYYQVLRKTSFSRASVASIASSLTPSSELIQEVDKCYELSFENAKEAFNGFLS